MLNIFKKPKQKEFSEMTRAEKKNFLECDLIERMIRIEQKVRGSMGEGIVAYYETNYFKELSQKGKNKFVKYLNSKKNAGKKKVLSFVVLLFFGAFMGMQMTANVVGASESNIPMINYIIIIAIILIGILYGLYIFFKSKKSKRFDHHFKIVEKFASRKPAKKK